MVRAGHHAAAVAIATASSQHSAIRPQGSVEPARCGVPRRPRPQGPRRSSRAHRAPCRRRAATAPTMAPLASTTRRRWRGRWPRWRRAGRAGAGGAGPPRRSPTAATRPTSAMASVAATSAPATATGPSSTTVSSLTDRPAVRTRRSPGPAGIAVGGRQQRVSDSTRRPRRGPRGRSRRSGRSGFSTRPTTVRSTPPERRPGRRCSAASRSATPWVSATSSGSSGSARRAAPASGWPKTPSGCLGPHVERLAPSPAPSTARVPDDLHRAEALAGRRPPRRSAPRRRWRRGRAMARGVAEARPRLDERRVDRHRRAGDGRPRRATVTQGQHQELLAPLAPEQAPGPAQHGPRAERARAPARRSRPAAGRRPSSDSGPAGGARLVDQPAVAQEHHPVGPRRQLRPRG